MSDHCAVRFVTEHQLIQRLVAEVRCGFGIVPFIGSGCSARSGILMGGEFSDYLGWTVAKCVADRRGWQGPNIGGRRWDLRRSGWPEYPTAAQLEAARLWALRHFVPLAEAVGLYVEEDPLTNRIKCMTSAVPGASLGLDHVLYAPIVPPFLRHPNARDVELTDGRNQISLHRLLTSRGVVEGGLMRRGISPTSEDAIVERAIRALHDWRATLRFLSELQIAPDGHSLFLDEPDDEVVNGFNIHITRGRRPNLIHTMLCHLRQPARMRVLLTTNFDDLIERAFAAQNRSISRVSIGKKGELLGADEVHALDTVVKLHGTSNDTRADFTLDDLPSITDRKRFFNYVRGGAPDSLDDRFVPGHLFVAGYSGSDARCLQLMKAVLEGDTKSKIFWLCNSKHDRERLAQLFQEKAYSGRVVATTTERVDLFLYELHQQLCLCLPPGSLSYHVNHNVAPERGFRPAPDTEQLSGAASAILRMAGWEQPSPPKHAPEIATKGSAALVTRKVLAIDGPSGVLSAMREAMNELARSHGLHKVWLELEDYADAASVAHALVQVIAERRGVFQISHELCSKGVSEPSSPLDAISLHKQWLKHLTLLQERLEFDPARWVVALYGRNGPGGCCGWTEKKFWNDEKYLELEVLLWALRDRGFNVFYAPYTAQRRKRDLARQRDLKDVISAAAIVQRAPRPDSIVEQAMESFSEHPVAHETHGPSVNPDWWLDVDLTSELKSGHDDNVYRETVRGVLHSGLHLDAATEPGKASAPGGEQQRFWRFDLFYAASLFRQSRHYTAFLGEGVLRCPKLFNHEGFDNDLMRYATLESFLKDFDDNPRVFYRKPGGFAWLYRDVRLALRCLTEAVSGAAHERAKADRSSANAPTRAGDHDAFELLPSQMLRSRTHFHIGEWYVRAFLSSGHANPLLEAMYHFYQSAIFAHRASNRELEKAIAEANEENKTLEQQNRDQHRMVIWRRGVRQLVRTVRRSSSPLAFWMGQAQLRPWFVAPDVCVVEELRRAGEEIGVIGSGDAAVLDVLEVELTQLKLRYDGRPRLYSALSLQGLSQGVQPLQTKQSTVPRAKRFDESELWSDDHDWPARIGGLIGDLVVEFRKNKSNGPELVLSAADLTAQANEPHTALEWFNRLVETTYLFLSRAKRQEHAVALEPISDLHGGSQAITWFVPLKYRRFLNPLKIRKYWVEVCRYANAAIQAADLLPPGAEAFINQQLSKVHAMYAIGLARLNRFNEAHRRLNHAQALLNEGEREGHLVRLGIIELRRGEAYLLEALLVQEAATTFNVNRGANCRGDTQQDWLMAIEKCLWRDARLVKRQTSKDSHVQLCRHGRSRRGLGKLYCRSQACRRRLLSDQREHGRATWIWLEPQLRSLSDAHFGGRAVTGQRDVESVTLFHARLHDEVSAGLRRITVARCDDAWGCLERAEELMGGRTHSPLWWSRLRTLQLHVLSVEQPGRLASHTGPLGNEHAQQTLDPSRLDPQRQSAPFYRSLTSRVRMDGASRRRRLWREGIAASPDEAYSRLRLLDYVARASLTALRAEGGPASPSCDELNQELKLILEMAPATKSAAECRYLDNVSLRIALLGAEQRPIAGDEK